MAIASRMDSELNIQCEPYHNLKEHLQAGYDLGRSTLGLPCFCSIGLDESLVLQPVASVCVHGHVLSMRAVAGK